MSRLLTTQAVSGLDYIFIYIFVSDRSLIIFYSHFVKCLIQTEVTHNSCNYLIVNELSALLHVKAVNIEDVIACNYISLFIHTETSVCISVISESNIQSLLNHKLLKMFNMC